MFFEVEILEIGVNFLCSIVMKLVMEKLIKRRMESDICLHELKKIISDCVLFVIHDIHSVTRYINLVICDFYTNEDVK